MNGYSKYYGNETATDELTTASNSTTKIKGMGITGETKKKFTLVHKDVKE